MNSYATTLLLSQINQIGGSQSCAKPNSYTRFWIWGRRKRLDCVQSLISSANTFILSPQPFCSCLTRNYMKYTKIDFQIHPKTLQIVSDTVFTKCPGSQSLVLFAPIELSIWRAPNTQRGVAFLLADVVRDPRATNNRLANGRSRSCAT